MNIEVHSLDTVTLSHGLPTLTSGNVFKHSLEKVKSPKRVLLLPCRRVEYGPPQNSDVDSYAQTSDVPKANNDRSDALKHRLAAADLLDLKLLLRYRGIRTLESLASLELTERAVLLCKARELYEHLGIPPSKLENTLNQLFGDVPPQGR